MSALGSVRDGAELSRRLGVTVLALVAFRLGTQLPLPGIDIAALPQLGGPAVERISIFALGIMPFVTVLILAELVKVFVPRVVRWEQAQERNRHRLGSIVIGLSLLAAAIQAAGLVLAMEDARGLVATPGTTFRLVAIATLVGSTAVVIWLADQITRNGLGSGVWLLVLTPWLATLPYQIAAFLLSSQWKPAGLPVGVELIAGLAIATVLLAAVVTLILAGGRTLETAATCLWSKLLAGTVWPWLILLIGLIFGGGSFQGTESWLAPPPALYLLQILMLAGFVALFAWLYMRAQRIASLPPLVLAGGLAAITFADIGLTRYLPGGALFIGRHILVAVVAMSILVRWWVPPIERRDAD
jgi:SecY